MLEALMKKVATWEQAWQESHRAHEDLRQLGRRERNAGNDVETPEYLKLNEAASQADQELPWLLRG